MCRGSAASGTCELPALLTQIISPPVLGTVCSIQTHFKAAALQQECFKKYNISICYSNSICCGSLLMDYVPFFAPIRCKNHSISQVLRAGRQCPNPAAEQFLFSCRSAPYTLVLLQRGRCRQGSSFFLKAVKSPSFTNFIFTLRANSTCGLQGCTRLYFAQGRAAQHHFPALTAPRD